MQIKVCGMRDPENIRAVSELGIDYIGLIFYPSSPRYVSSVSTHAGIIPDSPDSSLAEAGKSVKTVGVFVDEMPQTVVTQVYNYHLDFVQLHGEESPVYIDNLRSTLDPDIRPGIRIIKTISIRSAEDMVEAAQYEGHADMLLFDTKCESRGGSGDKFDWSVLNAYTGDIPFLLSGGIGPDDAERILAFRHPKCVGIDLNSRFETEPALKNIDKLRNFITSIKTKD